MSYNIALNFEDGVTRVITCNEGETVLDAAYRAQINLPMDCSDGVCGTCKGSCHQGEFDMGDEYIDEALSDEEAEQGMVLTCQMVPSSDCVVKIPAAASLCSKAGNESVTGTVGEVNLISPTAIELKITADADIGFLPGQVLGIPGLDHQLGHDVRVDLPCFRPVIHNHLRRHAGIGEQCPGAALLTVLIDGEPRLGQRRRTGLQPLEQSAAQGQARLFAGESAGAGLDVFEHGHEINPRLRELPNVVLLPHMGSATVEGRAEMGEKVIINIKTFADGHRPPDLVVPSML